MVSRTRIVSAVAADVAHAAASPRGVRGPGPGEAKDLRERITKREEGELSPYHKAAVRALRDLTNRDLPAKADAWRKLLKLPAKRDG